MLDGIDPIGWGVKGDNTDNIHYWEYNSCNLSNGKAVDISQRHPISRQLNLKKDKLLIEKYTIPSYILNGWNPKPI